MEQEDNGQDGPLWTRLAPIQARAARAIAEVRQAQDVAEVEGQDAAAGRRCQSGQETDRQAEREAEREVDEPSVDRQQQRAETERAKLDARAEAARERSAAELAGDDFPSSAEQAVEAGHQQERERNRPPPRRDPPGRDDPGLGL